MLRNDGLKYNLSPPTLVRCVSICLEKDEMLLNMQPLIMMIKREWILIKCIFHLDFKGVIYDTKTEVIIHKDNLLAPINCNSAIPQVINLVGRIYLFIRIDITFVQFVIFILVPCLQGNDKTIMYLM